MQYSMCWYTHNITGFRYFYFFDKSEVSRNLKLWLVPSFIKIYHHLKSHVLLAEVYICLHNPFSERITEISKADLKRDNQKISASASYNFCNQKPSFMNSHSEGED